MALFKAFCILILSNIAIVADFAAAAQTRDATPRIRWMRTIGTEADEDVGGAVVDSDGFLYVVGSAQGNVFGTHFGQSDIFLSKYAADGSEVWGRQFGTAGIEFANSIVLNRNNELIVGGVGFGQRYALLAYDLDGEGIWAKHPASSTGRGASVQQLALGTDGSIYTALLNGPLTKHRPDGEREWTNPVRVAQDVRISDVAVDRADNVFVAGYFNDLGRSFLYAFDADQSLLWSHHLMGGRQTVAYSPFDDAVYLGGHQTSAVLQKFDNNGAQLWSREFGDTAVINDIAVDGAGNVYVTGTTYGDFASSSGGLQDIFVQKFDSEGTALWAWQYGGELDDSGRSLSLGPGGELYLTANVNGASSLSTNVLLVAFVPEPSSYVTLCVAILSMLILSHAGGWKWLWPAPRNLIHVL
jgi:hypothetical protein